MVDLTEIKRYVRWRDEYKCVSCERTRDDFKDKKALPIYHLAEGINIPSTMITLCSSCHSTWANPQTPADAEAIRRRIDEYIDKDERAGTIAGFFLSYPKMSAERLIIELEGDLQEVKYWLFTGRSFFPWLSEDYLSDDFETELEPCIEDCPYESIRQNYVKWKAFRKENQINQRFVDLTDAIRAECKLYTEKRCSIHDNFV